MKKQPGFPMALMLALSAMPLTAVAFTDEPVEIANWTAPPYWASRATGTLEEQPESQGAVQHAHQGCRALVAGPTALPFIALPPCRLVDTRGNGAPLTGGFLPAATVRTYTLTSVCGVPQTRRPSP